MMEKRPIRIMFLCTGNSCRSQMAEGLAKALGEGKAEVYSAGLEPHGINPRAVAVMREIGIDISANTSDVIDQELLSSMDYAITLCSHAEEYCPVTPPSVQRLHWAFEDPAKAAGSEEEIMEKFREVRDSIARRIKQWLASI